MNELHTKHFVKVVFCEQLCYTNYVDAILHNQKIFSRLFSTFPHFQKNIIFENEFFSTFIYLNSQIK